MSAVAMGTKRPAPAGVGSTRAATARDVVAAAEDLLALVYSRPREALVRAETLLATRPPPAVAAVAHQVVALVLRDFGDATQALTEFRTALRMAARAGDVAREADVRAAYGVALVMVGRTRDGLEEIETAARAVPEAAGGRISLRKAHALWLLGEYGDLLDAAERAVALLAGDDVVWQARAVVHRALAYFWRGAFDRADRDYARGERLFSEAGQHLESVALRENRALLAFARGDLPSALRLLDETERVAEDLNILLPDIPATRVQVLLAAGLDRDALRVADQALERSQEQGASAARRSELLLSGAMAAAAAGDPTAAGDRSAQALRLFRRQRRPVWAARAELVLLESRFAVEGATPPVVRATARLARTAPGSEVALVARARLLAGRAALAAGHRQAAVRLLREAATSSRADLRARATRWVARALLADAQGNVRELLAAAARGLDAIDTQLAVLGASELRAQATAQGAQLARLALRQAMRSGDAALVLRWSERWRATALVAPPVRLDAESALTRDLAALRLVARTLETADLDAPATPALRRERRRLEDAVRRQALYQPGTGSRRRGRSTIGELRELLAGRQLVELAEVDGDLVAVLLGGRGRPRMHRIGPIAAADRAVQHALFALRRQGTARAALDVAAIGARVEQAVLGPVVEQLTADAVVLVPPGRLHAVPWALLPALDGRDVTVAPSAAVWMRCRRTIAPTQGRVVIVGGPRLDAGGVEVRRLAERYPDAEVLADGDATCERVLRAMDGAALVHVAAHGTFRADSPLLSALELDDGPLTVYDLQRLRRAPHRVVLSSCNSAVGAPTGVDELLGVVSALVALGSAGVVASVVPVDDPATVPFMLALHERLSCESLPRALAGARHDVEGEPGAALTARSFIALGA